MVVNDWLNYTSRLSDLWWRSEILHLHHRAGDCWSWRSRPLPRCACNNQQCNASQRAPTCYGNRHVSLRSRPILWTAVRRHTRRFNWMEVVLPHVRSMNVTFLNTTSNSHQQPSNRWCRVPGHTPTSEDTQRTAQPTSSAITTTPFEDFAP